MKYIITQKRDDAIGTVNKNLVPLFPDYEHVEINWGKNMLFNHFKEMLWCFKFRFKLKEGDVVFSTNSKSVSTHLLPVLSSKPDYSQLHFHFDENELLLHRLPFFSYERLFKTQRTIFATKTTEDIAKEKYLLKASTYAHCGIDHSVFQNRGMNRLPDYFLYVGSFLPRKNVERLLYSFMLYRRTHFEAKLVIINGYGPVDGFFEKVKELDLVDDIIYLRNVPKETLVLWYNVASAFVFPTLIEGFGLPLVEAMACGCPVITTRAGVHMEVTNHSATYVNPYDVREMSKAYGNLRPADLEFARGFTWDAMASKIQRFVESDKS